MFIFKTPAKSASLFAAAPGFEGDKVTYNGQKSVVFTMKESTTRNSAIGNPALTLVGRVGTIHVYPTHLSCSGISFPETDTHNTTAYSLNRPVIAVDADQKKFKIYVKAIAFPISLVEYTR